MANFRSLPMPQQNGLLRMRAGHRMRSPSTLSSACHTNGCEVRAMGSILQFFKRLGVLPPHECAYGCQLAGIEELSNRVRQILGLEFLDPQKTRIDVSVPGGGSGIGTLRRYCADLAKGNSRLEPLIAALKQLEKVQPAQEAAVRMIDLLVECRDALRNEASQDEIIVFLNFGLKEPANLDASTRETIGRLVEHVDTPEQMKQFNSRHCPQGLLKGNINIYPRFIENTTWYQLVDLDLTDRTRPILGLRFMGWGGAFIYLLDEIEKRLGCTFFHLDGESIDADREDNHAW